MQIIDAWLIGDEDGWVLTSGKCVHGSGGSCAEVLRTTDGGRHWAPLSPIPGIHVSDRQRCASPCVDHLRFADGRIGYLWGESAIFMTTDAGRRWVRQPGGADGLVIAGASVIRLVSDHSGCPGPCNLRVLIAPVGASRWSPVRLPGAPVDAGAVRLQRLAGGRVFLQSSQGQADSLYAVRSFVSSDAGRTWAQRPDPCRSVGAAAAGTPLASTQMTMGPEDHSLSILCANGGDTVADVITSSDAGRHFTASRVFDSTSHGAPLGAIGAVSAHVLFSATGAAGPGIYRSTDGGTTWREVVPLTGEGALSAPVFADATTGYLIGPDDRSLWLTHDAGNTWTRRRID